VKAGRQDPAPTRPASRLNESLNAIIVASVTTIEDPAGHDAPFTRRRGPMARAGRGKQRGNAGFRDKTRRDPGDHKRSDGEVDLLRE
jgi:hypothetical protein